MLRLLSFVIIYIVTLPLFAQNPAISLWGTVYDRHYREPLPGAYVLLLDSLDHTLRSVVTKTDGSYFLTGVPAGNFRITSLPELSTTCISVLHCTFTSRACSRTSSDFKEA